MSLQEQDLDEVLIHFAVRLGTTARRENVEKSQMEQLISSLEAYPHQRLCLPVVAMFARRQTARNVLGRETSRLVAEAMMELYKRGQDKAKARVLLGLAKWVYEAGETLPRERMPVKDFNEFLDLLSGKSSK